MTPSPFATSQLAPALPPDAGDSTPTGRPQQRPAPRWIPVRRLGARHAARVLRHLLTLSPHDRYLRFGYQPTDEQLGRHVAGLDFDRDQILGIFDRRLQLVAVAHLAFAPEASTWQLPAMAEFGVSVLESHRGKRLGARLFEQAVLHARNRGIETLFIHALSENTAMLKIARRAGATVERDGPESQAWLKLPAHNLASQVDQLLGLQAAELDYQWKRNARRFDRWVELLEDLRARFGERSGRIDRE